MPGWWRWLVIYVWVFGVGVIGCGAGGVGSGLVIYWWVLVVCSCLCWVFLGHDIRFWIVLRVFCYYCVFVYLRLTFRLEVGLGLLDTVEVRVCFLAGWVVYCDLG